MSHAVLYLQITTTILGIVPIDSVTKPTEVEEKGLMLLTDHSINLDSPFLVDLVSDAARDASVPSKEVINLETERVRCGLL
jgi:hypothetical protein